MNRKDWTIYGDDGAVLFHLADPNEFQIANMDAIIAVHDAQVRAARLLRAAAEDAKQLLDGITMPDNRRMIVAQVHTNLSNAIYQANRAGIERAATIKGDASTL